VFSAIFFQAGGTGAELDLRFLFLDGKVVISFAILISYLFLDWITAVKHIRFGEGEVKIFALAAYCASIWLVGISCVIVLGSNTIIPFLLLIYLVLIALYFAALSYRRVAISMFGSYSHGRAADSADQLILAFLVVVAVFSALFSAYHLTLSHYQLAAAWTRESTTLLLASSLFCLKAIRLVALDTQLSQREDQK
jgi:uncharacterized protein (DUF983 family)